MNESVVFEVFGCGSGGRAGHLRVAVATPSSPSLVEVSFDKILKPKLLPVVVPLVCECVCMGYLSIAPDDAISV